MHYWKICYVPTHVLQKLDSRWWPESCFWFLLQRIFIVLASMKLQTEWCHKNVHLNFGLMWHRYVSMWFKFVTNFIIHGVFCLHHVPFPPPRLSFWQLKTFLGLQPLFSSRIWSGTPVSAASSCLCSQLGWGGVTGFVERRPSDLWTPGTSLIFISSLQSPYGYISLYMCPPQSNLLLSCVQIDGRCCSAAAGWGSSEVLFYRPPLYICSCSWGIWQTRSSSSVKIRK